MRPRGRPSGLVHLLSCVGLIAGEVESGAPRARVTDASAEVAIRFWGTVGAPVAQRAVRSGPFVGLPVPLG
jgi:hypothetical protein